MKRRVVTVDYQVREPSPSLGQAESNVEAAAIANALWAKLWDHEREHFVLLSQDARCRVRGHKLIALGTLTSCWVHPREVFRAAIELNAASIVLAHNHPSGDPTPSEEDLTLARRLNEAGRLLGVPVNDHLIVTADPRLWRSYGGEEIR